MFKGLNGLEMTGDHLDISYRAPEAWPLLTPGGSIRAHIFDIGDPAAGPNIQLGLITPVEDEVLDWRHSIDPLHHHGSDQFRLIMSGGWTLAGRRLGPGSWSFQEAGMVYQEHPGSTGAASTMLMMADRRGLEATLALSRDEETMFRYGEVYGTPQPDRPYPHPAGDRGVTAIATSAGPAVKGFVFGMPAPEPASGVLGDTVAGPIVHMLSAGPGETLLPACTAETELLLALSSGSVGIGDTVYRAGDLRVQAEGRPMPAIVAGAEGVACVLIVADRRAKVTIAGNDPRPAWLDGVDRMTVGLTPVPGGPRPDHAVPAFA